MKLKSLLPKRSGRVKTPTVLQMEMVECGAASLSIVLGYYGRYVPLEELRVRCGVSRDGSKASNMLRAARAYGLKAKGYRKEPKALVEFPMPIIVHWNFNHFLVVEGFDGDKVFLNDPATGPRHVTSEEFNEAFTGVVLSFEKDDSFESGGSRSSLLPTLVKRVRGSTRALLFILLASLALVMPGLLIPTFARVFVDSILVEQMYGWVLPLLVGMIITAVVRVGLTWLQQYYLLRLETKLALTMSSQVVWHILRLPIEFFAQRSAGDISTRIRLNDRVAQLLSGELATTLLNMILIVFYAGLMWWYSPLLTLIVLAAAAANAGALRYVARRRVDANQRMLMDESKLYGTAFTGLQSIETIKATGSEDSFFSRWAGYQAKFVNAAQELGVATQVLAAVPMTLGALATSVVLLVGGYAVIDGSLTIGMLVAFQSLMTMFLQPVNQLVDMSTRLQDVEGMIARLDDVTNYEADPQVSVVPNLPESTNTRLSGHVEIRNLTFGYSRLADPLIQGFHLEVQPGRRVALVGGSGSGKSTIARLIAGLYTPWEGEIIFDNTARQQVSRAVLTRSLAVVDQNIFLFEGTVRDNLTMWNETIDEHALVQAARDAGIHDLILSRQEGYDSPVAEGGSNFSGGQRQRLEIARALVTNPSILVLDEATSALDPLTEKLIDDNLRRRGCTCIIVAHRLSTIRDSDEIIVLDKGKVVQRGSHDQLWRDRKGLYARLIRAETPESELLVDSLWETITT